MTAEWEQVTWEVVAEPDPWKPGDPFPPDPKQPPMKPGPSPLPPPGPPPRYGLLPPGEFRASDSDRDKVVAQLRAAYEDGRLDKQLYDERMAGVMETAGKAELALFTADLTAKAEVIAYDPGRCDMQAGHLTPLPAERGASGAGLLICGTAGLLSWVPFWVNRLPAWQYFHGGQYDNSWWPSVTLIGTILAVIGCVLAVMTEA